MLPSGCPRRTTYTSPGEKKLPVRGVTVICWMGTRLPAALRPVPRSSTQLRLWAILKVVCHLNAPVRFNVDRDISRPALHRSDVAQLAGVAGGGWDRHRKQQILGRRPIGVQRERNTVG